MTRHSCRGFRRLMLAAVCVVLVAPRLAAATPTPTPSPTSTPLDCTSGVIDPGDINNKLQNDYVTSGTNQWMTPCITLTNGRSLDLNGHTIKINGNGWIQWAIMCTQPGSSITDSGTVKGGITGAFIQTINDCESVQGLMIQEGSNPGFFGAGMYWAITNDETAPAATIRDNVIDGAFYAIDSLVKNNSTTISNNYITDTKIGITAETTASTPGPLYENNIIRGFLQLGIYVPQTGKIRVRRNLLFEKTDSEAFCIGTGDFVDPQNAGIVGNACECEVGCSLEAPYSFPFD